LEADATRSWLATCPRGLASLLADELKALGAETTQERSAGVLFEATRAVMYRCCLWSRVANRVLLPVGSGPGRDADTLYATLYEQAWETLLEPGASIAVVFTGSNDALRNTRFGAQKSKDAILDRCRARVGRAPRVNPREADIVIHVRLRSDQLDVALDLVGESLHRRGYRRGSGEAPIKENLAAALLLRAGWPELARGGAALIDPMCGSATLLIEGALMALDRAPALGRERFAFEAWAGHEAAQWSAIRKEAQNRALAGEQAADLEIRGYDADPRVIRRAQENITAAGLSRVVRVSVKSLGEIRRPTHRVLSRGLLITNPPYGERLGDPRALPQLYRRLGELAHDEFDGWEAAVLAPSADLGKALGLRSHRHYAFLNGTLPVNLYLLSLTDNRLVDNGPAPVRTSEHSDRVPSSQGAGSPATQVPIDEAGAQMLANRLRKNQRRLKSWLKQTGYSCYRLYDADMPEFAVAIDRYEDWVHVAEYRAPADVPKETADQRLATVQAVVPAVCGVPEERVVFKRRERQRGRDQYERFDRRDDFVSVREGSARLLVNLHDYLDTGLFLDHRPLRRRIAEEARGGRFLNLYCYTGTATIHAALGGARETVSVDLSNTYLGWLGRNLALNGLAEGRHRRIRADVFAWLYKAEAALFDLILLDPPSFSNSKAVVGSFDVQRDHAKLVELSMALLAPDGSLYFSNNRRRFSLDASLSERFVVEDITAKTLDRDFPRTPPPHRCWRIRHR